MAGALGGTGALPVAAEIDRWSAPHGQPDRTMHLLAVAEAPGVLPPGGLVGVTEQIRPRDVMVVPQFAAAQAGEVGLRAVVQAPSML
jgi:hypothetical protein